MLYQVAEAIDDFLWGTPFLLVLVIAGVVLTLRTGFFGFRYFGHIMKNTFGRITSKEANTKNDGSISPFEAMCVAIGGCVGTGNMGGVAAAIAAGGPGAVFWMWVWAFFGMTIKMSEVTLACHYRKKDEKGHYFGGPTYYMARGIGEEKGNKLGPILACLFGIVFVLQFLSGSQAYTISEALYNSFGISQIGFTLVYSAFLFYIIWKGVPRIAKTAGRLVPFMCVLYLAGGLGLIIINISNLPNAIAMIFKGAFTGTAAMGGFVGATVSAAIRKGVSRSMNSNEAGQGTSPMIHAEANTVHPVRQGLWGTFEVFIDTIVVCSITAFAILCTGVWNSGLTSTGLTISAFEQGFGQAGVIFVGIVSILFGLTTTAGWFAYFESILNHGLGHNPALKNKMVTLFKFLYPLPNIAIVTAIVLTGNGPELFWMIIDISLVFPVFFNVIALLLLSGKVQALVKDYKARFLGVGQVDPSFKVFYDDTAGTPVPVATAATNEREE